MRARWASSPAQRGSSAVAGSRASSVLAALVAESWMGAARSPGREAATQKSKEPKEPVQKTLELESKSIASFGNNCYGGKSKLRWMTYTRGRMLFNNGSH